MAPCMMLLHVVNVLLLVIVMGGTLYYIWPALETRTFATDVGSLSQYIGALSSAAATVAFVILACGESQCAAVIATLFTVIDTVCYAIWAIKGSLGMVCTGAMSLSTKVTMNVGDFVQCDAPWMRTVLLVLLGFSAGCQMGLVVWACCRTCSRPEPAAPQQALGKPAMHARSLGARSGRASRGRYAVIGGRRGMAEEDEEERLAGRRGRRTSVSEDSSESDENPWEEKGRR